MKGVTKAVVGALVLVPLLYIASYGVVGHQRGQAFAQVGEGDAASQVIQIMGEPTDREVAGGPRLIKYGANACSAPCAQRLWYANTLSLVGEAWLVDLDGSGHVIHTAHLTSP